MDLGQLFKGAVSAASGTNEITVVARDASGNQTSQDYEVDVTGQSKTFSYDANGNLTSDGPRTFEWDARNQLLAVTVGTHRSEFSYDGQQRRVRIVEKENSVVQSDTKVIWCRVQICEERAADGTTVTRRTFQQGEQVAGVGRFFTSDHLGSVTEVTDGTSSVLVRYAFDPWGRRALTAGTDATTVGYAAYRRQTSGDVSFTLYRFRLNGGRSAPVVADDERAPLKRTCLVYDVDLVVVLPVFPSIPLASGARRAPPSRL